MRRAARRFALASFAGELATEAGVTGWQAGEARRAAVACFRAWLDQRGTAGGREGQQIAEKLRHFIAEHGASRFETLRDDAQERAPGDMGGAQTEEALPEGRAVPKRAGWRWQEANDKGERYWVYGISADTFAAELCQPLGMTPKEAREKLAAEGLIRMEQRKGEAYRRTLIRRRVPGVGRPELVTVEPAIWGSDEAGGA